MDDIFSTLLGATEYEMRAYRALLTDYPATAYRIGKAAGVPLSRIYEVADRMVASGLAVRLPGRPTRYTPAPPDVVVASAQLRATEALEAGGAALRSLASDGAVTCPIWVSGSPDVADFVRREIAGASGDATVIADAGTAHQLQALCATTASPRIEVGPLPHGHFALLVPGRRLLFGSLGSQAYVLATESPAAIALAESYVVPQAPPEDTRSGIRLDDQTHEHERRWIEWEEAKHWRLLRSTAVQQVHN